MVNPVCYFVSFIVFLSSKWDKVEDKAGGRVWKYGTMDMILGLGLGST